MTDDELTARCMKWGAAMLATGDALDAKVANLLAKREKESRHSSKPRTFKARTPRGDRIELDAATVSRLVVNGGTK